MEYVACVICHRKQGDSVHDTTKENTGEVQHQFVPGPILSEKVENNMTIVYCPHCGFSGTDDEVDEHRATGVHNDEPQAGSNLPERPRS